MTDFERNIMPKLAKEYMEAGNIKIPFDKDEIRNLGRDHGFSTQGWDETLLQDEIDGLLKKGLIEELGNGKYQISKLGIERYS